MNKYFDNSDMFAVLLKWKKQLAIIILLSAVLSALFSFFLKTKYKSEAIVYPANLMPYSAETQTEQLLQLCNSKDVMDSVIEHCHLASHYGIDTANPRYYSAIVDEFRDNVSFSKTEYESVLIEVFDTHPQMACDMVSMIISMVNAKAKRLQQEKAWEMVKNKERQLKNKQHELDSLDAVLTQIRTQYGLLSYDVQVEEVVKRYLKERTEPGYNPNDPASKEILELIKNLKEKGGEFIALKENIIKERTFYNEIKVEYETALKDARKELTFTNVVTYPKPADTKSYPIRWLIVFISVLSSTMIGIVGVLLFEKYKNKLT